MAVAVEHAVPEGQIVQIVDEGTFQVIVRTRQFGDIQVYMTSTDPVSVGQTVFVVPLNGGGAVGVVKTLSGLGDDFANNPQCRRFVIPG